MKKLMRTVPTPIGDDSVVHEDILEVDTQIININDTHISVCMGCHKHKALKGKDLCKECQDKMDRGIPFEVIDVV